MANFLPNFATASLLLAVEFCCVSSPSSPAELLGELRTELPDAAAKLVALTWSPRLEVGCGLAGGLLTLFTFFCFFGASQAERRLLEKSMYTRDEKMQSTSSTQIGKMCSTALETRKEVALVWFAIIMNM